jgi:uncharacterized protein (TIGR00730 family)
MADKTWHILKMVAEFVEGFETLEDLGPAITVFGSARVKPEHPQYGQAMEAGRLIAEAGYATITGGGPGIMEAANRGAMEAGGRSVGLNIRLPREQGANPYQNVSVEFKHFYARKVCFLKHCRGVLCFPGGFGTLDEFFELVTLIQTAKGPRIPVALMGSAFWGRLTEFVRCAMLASDPPYVDQADLGLFKVFDDVREAVEFVCD